MILVYKYRRCLFHSVGRIRDLVAISSSECAQGVPRGTAVASGWRRVDRIALAGTARELVDVVRERLRHKFDSFACGEVRQQHGCQIRNGQLSSDRHCYR